MLHYRPANPDRLCRRGGAPRGRGGRGAARDGWSGRGREFDRQSGTGRGKEISKDGAGARNWGSNADAAKQGDAADAAAPSPEGLASPTAEGDAAAPEGDAAAAAAPPEPEEVVLTLEDVEKARLAKRSGDLFVTQKEDTSALLAAFKGAKRVDRNALDEEGAFLSGKLYGGAKASAAEAAAAEEKEEAEKREATFLSNASVSTINTTMPPPPPLPCSRDCRAPRLQLRGTGPARGRRRRDRRAGRARGLPWRPWRL